MGKMPKGFFCGDALLAYDIALYKQGGDSSLRGETSDCRMKHTATIEIRFGWRICLSGVEGTI